MLKSESPFGISLFAPRGLWNEKRPFWNRNRAQTRMDTRLTPGLSRRGSRVRAPSTPPNKTTACARNCASRLSFVLSRRTKRTLGTQATALGFPFTSRRAASLSRQPDRPFSDLGDSFPHFLTIATAWPAGRRRGGACPVARDLCSHGVPMSVGLTDQFRLSDLGLFRSWQWSIDVHKSWFTRMLVPVFVVLQGSSDPFIARSSHR